MSIENENSEFQLYELNEVIDYIAAGDFYDDYDKSSRYLGVLRKAAKTLQDRDLKEVAVHLNADELEKLNGLTQLWDDLKDNLPSSDKEAAEALFDMGDKLADGLDAFKKCGVVKPLEWIETDYSLRSSCGTYSAVHCQNDMWVSDGGAGIMREKTAEAFKAAAQAEHDKRIGSTISIRLADEVAAETKAQVIEAAKARMHPELRSMLSRGQAVNLIDELHSPETRAVEDLRAENERLRELMSLAHATMRVCGWHMAPASEHEGDGVLEAAVAEIEEKFRHELWAGQGAEVAPENDECEAGPGAPGL